MYIFLFSKVTYADGQDCKEQLIGPADSLEVPAVTISFYPINHEMLAGEIWDISAEIKNLSKQTVWIVQGFTILNIPAELYGINSPIYSGQIASFSTSRDYTDQKDYKIEDYVLRLDPGTSYNISWVLDPFEIEKQNMSWYYVFKRVNFIIRSFLFFQPRAYTAAVNVHIWTKPPCIKDFRVVDPGNSFVASQAFQINVLAPQWILIIGAILGGLLCFTLRLILELRTSPIQIRSGFRYIILGIFSAILLSSIVTILIARLSTTDFLVAVKVQDFWGAIATGFIIQWFGLPFLAKKLEAIVDTEVDLNEIDPKPTDQQNNGK